MRFFLIELCLREMTVVAVWKPQFENERVSKQNKAQD